MDWAERRGLMVLHVSFSLLVLRQAASVTAPPVLECGSEIIVCERDSTEINCRTGLINICTAVYGRRDITTCPNRQDSDANCGVDVVAALGPDCNGRSQCSVTAANSLAGDPCRGTHKYLEVAYTCKGIDECTAGTHSCDANATCQNAPGSFFCTCNIGYSGNGFSCTDIDECTSRPDTCNTNAACTNTPGSFKCTCNPGYRGDGSTCTDVNECKIGTDNCYANSACTNSPGSFTCTCNEGYTFNGTGCIVNPMITVTTIGPSPPASAGHRGAVVPAVVVVIVVILMVVIVAVIWYRRRRFSSTKDQGPHQTSTAAVLNPNYMIDNDQNEYAECANPVSPSNPAITTGSLEDALQHDYTELHTSVQPSKQDNVNIYNVVGEEDYTVLFGGKEHDDYHEYTLPEKGQDASPQGPYQGLLREGTYQEITAGYNVKKTVGIGLNQGPADERKNTPGYEKNPVTPRKLDENAYQDLSKKDDNYTLLRLDAGLPTSPSTQDHNLTIENSYQALQIAEPEYLELIANDTSMAPEQLNVNDYENL